MAATVDKKKALTKANLLFAFHHFDVDNEGYITKNDLKEVFKRQGQKLSDDIINDIIRTAHENQGEECKEIKLIMPELPSSQDENKFQ